MTETLSPGAEANATDALAERLFAAAIGALELGSVHIGGQLGFYRALDNGGDATPGELAARTGTVERYMREWLEQQAAAGFLSVANPDASATERRYLLPAAHRAVFVDEESLYFLTPLAAGVLRAASPIEAVMEAFRSGGGVSYEAYDLHDAIAALNRPQYMHLMADWLGSIPEVDSRLRAQPPARVADLACGTAWSSIAIARAYPDVTVDATDADAESIAIAQETVSAAGVADRVRPTVRDASDPALGGPYDLITIFEALHDLNHPVEALRAARLALRDGGSVLIADERVGERFTAPSDELERLNYAFSVLHCLAVGSLDPDSARTGTVMRPDTVRAYAAEAGFDRLDVLPIEHDFWRFYRLIP